MKKTPIFDKYLSQEHESERAFDSHNGNSFPGQKLKVSTFFYVTLRCTEGEMQLLRHSYDLDDPVD